jgi:hypothetical protein
VLRADHAPVISTLLLVSEVWAALVLARLDLATREGSLRRVRWWHRCPWKPWSPSIVWQIGRTDAECQRYARLVEAQVKIRFELVATLASHAYEWPPMSVLESFPCQQFCVVT